MAFGNGMRRFTLALAVAQVLVAQEVDMAEKLFSSGERSYAAKDYPAAIETWNQVLQQAPKSPFAARALLMLARHQIEVERKPEAALPFLERIKTEHLKTAWAAEAIMYRGRILADRSRGPVELKEAMAEYNRVTDLFPDHPVVQEARLQMGLGFRLQGQLGRALQSFTEAMRLDPGSPVACKAELEAAETLDLMGDLTGCLRMLQGLRNHAPKSAEAAEAAWRLQVRVKQRILKPALRSEGPWPGGKQKWLKTPTVLATGPAGELYVFQDDLDHAFLLQDGNLTSVGPTGKGAKAMIIPAQGQVWLVTSKTGVVKDEGAAAPAILPLQSPTGAFRDGWGNLWLSDSRATAIQVVPTEGTARSVPGNGVVAMAAMPGDGVAIASDNARTLQFTDNEGRVKVSIPYGKDLPAPYKYVLAMASDPLGHVAALVDGDFEGVVLWGPDGSLLRSATYKSLNVSGKFRAIALDRQGGIILADRSNDLLIRLD
jgi:TolA-binding protein